MSEQKSLTSRWIVIGIVVAAAVFAFLSHRSPSKPFGMALGQDLRGGTTLRFSLDLERARRENKGIPANMSNSAIVAETLKVIETRVNKFGLAEINLVQIGDDKFEISVPIEVDAESVKKVVSALGELEFLIEVLPSYGEFRGDNGQLRARNKVWTGATGAGPEGVTYDDSFDGFEKFKAAEVDRWKRARELSQPYVASDPRWRLVPRENSKRSTPADFVVLEEPVPGQHPMKGDILTNIRPGPDNGGRPGVHFDVKVDFQNVFAEWTGANVGLPMAIILNGEYHSAPQIHSRLKDSVVITLGGGAALLGAGAQSETQRLEAEQKQMVAVLQSGSLKVQPVEEAASTVGPTLAGQVVQRGLLSTAIAFLLVLVYMAIYYFAAGMIANVALLLNLVLLVGAMSFLGATLTLPGIAGIVLTLGMAVDANILVYERIREEQARGRSVQRAVGEGFDRAFTTIVDSNVTTFFTALFLYVFGSGSIKGFAVTLTLGLLASMFTAVYVTRAMFETWLKSGRVKQIKMLGTGKPPTFRWMHLRRYFITSSILAMAAGILIFAASPRETIYDIDFTGGMKVQARFAQPTTIDVVKKSLDSGPKAVRIDKPGASAEAVQTQEVTTGPYGGAEVVTVGSGDYQVEVRHSLPTAKEGSRVLSGREQLDAFRAYIGLVLQDRLVPPWVIVRPMTYKFDDDKDARKDEHKDFDGRLTLRIALEDASKALTPEILKEVLTSKMPYFDYEADGRRRTKMSPDKVVRKIDVREVKAEGQTASGRARQFDLWWKADRAGGGAAVEDSPDSLVVDLREFVGGTSFGEALTSAGLSRENAAGVALADPFPVNDLIGEGVARRQRNDAVLALLLSFAAIILYVAFRFRSYAMGFSAVFCLVHDVLIALGFVCLVDHLGIVDAKINLGLVAAFLTIVGYSVNDTVVTFDRIRELRGKAPTITTKMIEDAVNQTFSRTLRTTATVLLTVIVLFLLNVGQRSMLEGLSFTLMIGILCGGYSTIGVASPLLLFLPWFWAKARKYRPRAWLLTWPAKKPNGLILLGVAVAVTIAGAVLRESILMGVFFGLILTPLLLTVVAWLLWAAAFAVGCFIAACVMVVPWSFHEDPEAALDDVRRSGELPAPAPVPAPPTPARPGEEVDVPRSAKYRPKGAGPA